MEVVTKATRFGIELAGRLAFEQCRTFTAALRETSERSSQ